MKNKGIRCTAPEGLVRKGNLAWLLLGATAEIIMAVPTLMEPVETKAAGNSVFEIVQESCGIAAAMEENIHTGAPVIETLVQEPEDILDSLDPSELDLFARCVESEAGNQGLYGKQLVADVILNRVESPNFPDTISEVILQRGKNGVWQFSVAGDGALERAVPTEETYEAIRTELAQVQQPSLMYFSAEGFLPYGTPWQKVGGHYFNTGE